LLSELSMDDTSIWLDTDPVHCTEVTYKALTVAVMTALDELADSISSDSEEPAPKRSRLESVVVVRESTNPQKN
jgi:hypothetical protein